MQGTFKHPWLTVLVMALVVGAVGHRAIFVEQDNSPDAFFAADAGARRTYHELLETFGGDELVLIQLRGARPDRVDDVEALLKLSRALRRAPGVAEVISPASDLLDDDPDEPVQRPEPAQLAMLRRELDAVSLYRKIGIYTPDRPALGVAAVVVMRGSLARLKLARHVDRLAADLRASGQRPLVAGLALANAAIDREARRSLMLFMPLSVLLNLVIGLVLFRSVRAVLAMFLPVIGAAALGVAGLELAGEPLSLVTSVVPPLTLSICFAGAIHLLTHYATCCGRGLEPVEAVRQTIRDKLTPTAFAFLTTAMGFGSLALSEVRPIRVMGLATAGSLLVGLVLVTLGTPALVLILRPRLAAPPHRRHALATLAMVSLRRRGLVITIFALVGAALLAGGGRLATSNDGMELLARDAPERAAYQQLEREGLGLGNVDIWLQQPLPDDAALLASARRLRRMARNLERVPGVTAAVGVHDVLEILGYRMFGRAEVPATLAALVAMDDEARAQLRERLRRFWHPGRGLKLSLFTTTGDERTLAVQAHRAREAAARYFPGAGVEVSGHFTMLMGTPGTLMRTLGRSLAASVAVVSLLFLVLLRSLRLTLIGMLANLLPVGLVLGAMGWLGVKLDVVTVMTASIAYGVAVDDTFHYLYHRSRSGSTVEAAKIAGQGIVATSMVISGGFAVLTVSGFNPMVHFGVVAVAAILIALLVDAVLLPALVGQSKPTKEVRL